MPDSYGVDDMARDTAEAIKALKLERVSIFGASQGGMIAMKIAVEYPLAYHQKATTEYLQAG